MLVILHRLGIGSRILLLLLLLLLLQPMKAAIQICRQATVRSTSPAPIADARNVPRQIVTIVTTTSGRGASRLLTVGAVKYDAAHAGIVVVEGDAVRLLNRRSGFRQGRCEVFRVQRGVRGRSHCFVARRRVDGGLIGPVVARCGSIGYLTDQCNTSTNTGRRMKRRQELSRRRCLWRRSFAATAVGVNRAVAAATARAPDQRWLCQGSGGSSGGIALVISTPHHTGNAASTVSLWSWRVLVGISRAEGTCILLLVPCEIPREFGKFANCQMSRPARGKK